MLLELGFLGIKMLGVGMGASGRGTQHMMYFTSYPKSLQGTLPTHLDVPANILVQYENMATSLAVLSVHLQAQINEEKK